MEPRLPLLDVPDDVGVALDDAACVRASIDHPDAFRVLFDRHNDRVRRYVVSRVGPQAADDVVADAFVAAFRARDRFDSDAGSSAVPWLLGIATNVLARHRAAERRWYAQCAAAARAVEPSPRFEDGADARADASDASAQLARYLRQLPRREREPLLLHAVAECSYEDIADLLDVPIGTVRSRISRGRARLTEWMEATR
jgi:RNA polymerase sigma-70 factor (ECF subfamily)